MNITTDQAIHIYAHGLRYRGGQGASLLARQEAERLRAAGDDEGYEVWNLVAVHIEKLNSADEPSKQTLRVYQPSLFAGA
ncbi:MAG: hypothetical protein ACK4MV_02620 [Beijerinckiaceae bacterium]